MAVAFYVPDDEGSGETATQSASGASSVVHSPPLSPVSPEILMQAFWEALYRCSQGSAMETPQSPSSPSCAGTPRRIFFPPNGQQQQQQQQQQIFHYNCPHQHIVQSSPGTPESPHHGAHNNNSCVHTPIRHVPRSRTRLSSVGDELQSDDREILSNCASDDVSSRTTTTTTFDASNDLDLHYRHMEARERLTLFSGQLPPPKIAKKHKRKSSKQEEKKDDPISEAKPKSKRKEPIKSWRSIFVAILIAIGCGYLVSR